MTKDNTLRLLLKNMRDDISEHGPDWIVVSANALGVAAVVLASLNANPFEHAASGPATPPADITLASLD